MDPPSDDHTKSSKPEKERQMLYDITCMWNLKYNRNELIHEAERDYRDRLVVAKTGGCGAGYFGPLGLADANYYIFLSLFSH